MIDIQYRDVNISDAMSQEIDGDHGYGKPFLVILVDVQLVAILSSEILSEAQSLCFKPRLLKFYQYQMTFPICLPDLGTKVNAEHGQPVLRLVGIFVRTQLDTLNLFLQQSREYGFGYTFILHEVFEH